VFSHSYKGEQNIDWHVGLYTFVVMPHWERQTCRSWYMP